MNIWITDLVLTAEKTPAMASTTPSDPQYSIDMLTRRQLEISRMIAEGLSNRQIAKQLFISQRTVDAHVQHILVKLNINNRAQLSSWYTQRQRES